MVANMAEMWYSNGCISNSMRPGDLMFVSTLWFLGSANAMTSSDLTLNEQKTGWPKYGGNVVLKWL